MSDMSWMYYSLDPAIDSEQTALDLRSKALKLLGEIKTNTEWQGEGVSSKKQIVIEIGKLLAMTSRFLHLKNPQKYGPLVRQSSVLRIR